MKVRATRRGTYNLQLRREGDVFTLRSPAHFKAAWMVRVDPSTPEHTTTAQQALNRLQDERSPLEGVRRPSRSFEDEAPGGVIFDADPFAD
jgi:hypothetical protein